MILEIYGFGQCWNLGGLDLTYRRLVPAMNSLGMVQVEKFDIVHGLSVAV
jgi:hypothetical protein